MQDNIHSLQSRLLKLFNDFPGSSGEDSAFQCSREVQSLIGELRSHKPHDVAKKNKMVGGILIKMIFKQTSKTRRKRHGYQGGALF